MDKSVMRVLILDDDDVFTQVLQRQLHNDPATAYQVCVANTGEAAAAALAQQAADIILVDLKLADDSGLRWLGQLRQLCPQARIIMVTAYASIATTVEAVKRGADDYLPKPFSLQQLKQTMQAGVQLDKQPNHMPTRNADIQDGMSLKRLQWEHIQRVLETHNGNVSAAARALGMHRRTLQRKLQKKPTE